MRKRVIIKMDAYQDLISLLNKKGFHAEYFDEAEGAKQRVMALIAAAHTVGIGGSMTLSETGIFDAVVNQGDKIIYSQVLEKQKENPDCMGIWRKALLADAYLTSTNALTLQGELINIDGNGNRVASMFFGPDRVIVVCGTNKITKNPHDAIARIKREACPLNARRLHLDTPCNHQGVCADCDSPDRMCNVTVRIQYPPRGKDIYILLIGQKLGY